MKKMLFFVALLILVSCATKKINFSQLQDRNGLYYLVNEDKPFNGEVVSYVNGKVEFEGEIKNGLREGIWTYYYPSGQKKIEGLFTDGLKEGTWNYWKENGAQDVLEVYKMGKRLGNDGTVEEPAKIDSAATPPPAAVQPKPAAKPATVAAKEEKKPEPQKPKPVVWERLRGGPIKTLDGIPYTGSVIKYYRDGATELEGQFTRGRRTGKWVFYDKFGNIKDVRYY